MNDIIPPSELILNPDGSVYHLNLLPQDIADAIITVGDPERVPQVSKHFDQITLRKSKREFLIHTGTMNGKPLTVMSTGMGTDNIDIVMNELDALVNINLNSRQPKKELTSLNIVRIGTCGGLHPELDVDSYVISSGSFGLEGLMHTYQYEPTKEQVDMQEAFIRQCAVQQHEVQPLYFNASEQLINLLGQDMHHGITATCGGFYAPQGRQLRLRAAKPKVLDQLQQFEHNGQRILNFEMETAALYGLGSLLGHQCVSISAVIANRALKKFSPNYKQTVEELIALVLQRLTTG